MSEVCLNRSLRLAVIGLLSAVFLMGGVLLSGCSSQMGADAGEEGGPKIGVLLVNHGSNSKQWRQMLRDVEKAVRDDIMADGRVADVKTAFMEYNEPSIATQMKAFDAAGFDEVIVVPLFLTVSSHSLNDIPTIVGINADPKVIERLAAEEIDVYAAKARVTLVPTLDFSALLKKNVLQRVQAMAEDMADLGVVLVAYGDARFNQQWEELMDEVGRYVKAKAGIETVAYSWCGHLVDYSPEPTMQAIRRVFELEDRVAVVPLLVAVDPAFQEDIIGVAVEESRPEGEILYEGDAILPDPGLNEWILEITADAVARRS